MNPFDDIYVRDDDGNMYYEQYTDIEGTAIWPIEEFDSYDPQLDQFGWL